MRDDNKDFSESSGVLTRIYNDNEQKKTLHEIRQQGRFLEIELKKSSLHSTEENRDSHDTEENGNHGTEEKTNHSNSHETGGKINSHEGDEPPEDGTIACQSPNALNPIKKRRGGWKLAFLLLDIYP